MIRVADLNVAYGRTQVVKSAGFSVAAGESFGLVGESGSGKSTILRAIMGLADDWTGSITVDGLDLRTARRADYIRRVQMVFQDPYGSLHPRHMIGQSIIEPMHIQGITGAEKRCLDLLDLIGLTPAHRFRYPHELSGGQRQRVAIARALALQPKALLLDEPTSALDVSIQAEILNLLNRLRRDLGLTYVIVSHDLAVISYMCERLAVMRNAQILETLTREDLRAGRFASDYTRMLVEAADA